VLCVALQKVFFGEAGNKLGRALIQKHLAGVWIRNFGSADSKGAGVASALRRHHTSRSDVEARAGVSLSPLPKVLSSRRIPASFF
jgi:hypothetical protein